MKSKAIKLILLESLKAAEKTVEADLNNDKDTKKTMQYLLHFFKFSGIEIIEKLALEGKSYIQHQIQYGIETSTKVIAKVVSSLMTLIIMFLTVSIGLMFGAIAFSLWIGDYFENTALGFLIVGIFWVVIMLIFTKIFFNKKYIEQLISKKMAN